MFTTGWSLGDMAAKKLWGRRHASPVSKSVQAQHYKCNGWIFELSPEVLRRSRRYFGVAEAAAASLKPVARAQTTVRSIDAISYDMRPTPWRAAPHVSTRSRPESSKVTWREPKV